MWRTPKVSVLVFGSLIILKKIQPLFNYKYVLKLILIMSIKSVQCEGVRNNDVIIALDGDVEDTGGYWLGFWFLDNPEKNVNLCNQL